MSLFSVFGMFGCSSTSLLNDGHFDGQKYKLHSTEYVGFTTNSFKWRFKLGRLPAVDINATTTEWGVPYSDDIYGSAPFVYTTERRLPYTHEENYTPVVTNTMLYLSPKRFSQSDFDQYVRFMKREWPSIDALYATETGSRSFPHIIGLVYGRREDFEQVFKDSKASNGDPQHYTVYNDGRIVLGTATGTTNSWLSPNVQMPGRLIEMYTYPGKPYYGVTLEKLKTYRDSKGKTIPDYFTVVSKERSE